MTNEHVFEVHVGAPALIPCLESFTDLPNILYLTRVGERSIPSGVSALLRFLQLNHESASGLALLLVETEGQASTAVFTKLLLATYTPEIAAVREVACLQYCLVAEMQIICVLLQHGLGTKVSCIARHQRSNTRGLTNASIHNCLDLIQHCFKHSGSCFM